MKPTFSSSNSPAPLFLMLGKNTLPRINTMIAEICHRTKTSFIDIYSPFIQETGHLFQADGIHLTEEGYLLWVRTVLEHIAFMNEND